MRRRILIALIGVAASAILILGLPLVLAGRILINDEAARRAQRELDTIVTDLGDPKELTVERLQRRLEAEAGKGRSIEVDVATGGTVNIGEAPRHAISVRDDIGTFGTITLRVPGAEERDRRLALYGVVAALALLGVGVAALIGLVLARRLTRPLDDLASASARLGSGDFAARAPRSGLPETDEVAASLDAAADRIGRLVRAEREFSANASHQLRTPLTAMRIRLEEISLVSDATVLEGADVKVIHEEAVAALEQADRLDATITELLALARAGRVGRVGVVDLTAIVRERAAEWLAPLRAANRYLELRAPSAPVMARATPGGAGHALDVLVDNALAHGRGRITIELAPNDDAVEIRVSDEGPGVPVGQEQAVFERGVSGGGGTGVGLALARELVEADGGHVDLVTPRPATFRILYGKP